MEWKVNILYSAELKIQWFIFHFNGSFTHPQLCKIVCCRMWFFRVCTSSSPWHTSLCNIPKSHFSTSPLALSGQSSHCCLKVLILLLALSIVRCFPWSHRLLSFIVKTSAKYTVLNIHSLSIILSGKNGGPWITGASWAHTSVNTSAYPGDSRQPSVWNRSALNVLSISSHRILKSLAPKGRDLMKLIFLLLHQRLSEMKLAVVFFFSCTWTLVKDTIAISPACFHGLKLY